MNTYVTRIVILSAIVGALWLFDGGLPLFPEKEMRTEEEWGRRIEQVGGKAAYKELAHAVADLEESQKHSQAHRFGGALYTIEGLDGLAVCDTQFSYGCFHEFLGLAIAEHGMSSLPELNRRCFDYLEGNGLACQHGIGHGVQAFYGYTEEHLLEALSACSKTAHIDPIGGCYSGVFMEYNFQLMLGDQAKTREFDSLLSPCDVLDDAYMQSCVFAQPQWWYQSKLIHEPVLLAFKTLGEYCDILAPADPLSHVCYAGIGNIAPQVSNYAPDKIRTLCTATGGDKKRTLSCLTNAANSVGVTTTTSDAEKVCIELSGEALEHCLAYARNRANALITRPLPNI